MFKHNYINNTFLLHGQLKLSIREVDAQHIPEAVLLETGEELDFHCEHVACHGAMRLVWATNWKLTECLISVANLKRMVFVTTENTKDYKRLL